MTDEKNIIDAANILSKLKNHSDTKEPQNIKQETPQNIKQETPQNIKQEEIYGLDAEEEDYVYITHTLNLEKKFKFSTENLKKSNVLSDIYNNDKTIINSEKPIVITIGGIEEYMLIIKYLDFYSLSKVEADPPEMPLIRDKPIEEIFEFEYIIFKDLFDLKDWKIRLLLLRKIMHLVNYLEMDKLIHKICAIVAYYYMQIASPEDRIELEVMLQSLNINE